MNKILIKDMLHPNEDPDMNELLVSLIDYCDANDIDLEMLDHVSQTRDVNIFYVANIADILMDIYKNHDRISDRKWYANLSAIGNEQGNDFKLNLLRIILLIHIAHINGPSEAECYLANNARVNTVNFICFVPCILKLLRSNKWTNEFIYISDYKVITQIIALAIIRLNGLFDMYISIDKIMNDDEEEKTKLRRLSSEDN